MLMEARTAYRRHLEELARSGDETHSGGTFRALLRAVNDLPAACLDHRRERVWVWSDLHIGHENVIRYCDRPFADAEEMNERLHTNWRETVGDDDLLLFVGDVAMWPALRDGVWERIRGAAGGTRRLVVGNHDLTGSGRLRIDGFDAVHSLLCLPGDPPLLFTHLPLGDVPPGWVNVHGHTHDSPVARSPHINVSVEQIDYRPLALPRILALAGELVRGRYPPGETTLERIENLNGAAAPLITS